MRAVAGGAVIAATLAATAGLAQAAPVSVTDWRAATTADLRAFHGSIMANHPGPVNARDPAFVRRERAAYRLALARAAQVRDRAGHDWTLRGYVASFDDGHVALSQRGPALPARWPGFLTGFDGRGRQVVASRAADAPLPLGAELLACDGIAAGPLAARQVGAFRGRWQLSGQRAIGGGRLFVDAGNPFVRRPARCRFRVDGAVRDVALSWRAIPEPALAERLNETAPRARPAIAARTLADGTRWFAMSSFDGDPEGVVARALIPMIAGMARDRDAIARAPAVVLDLRGNGGGSSDWSQQVARILWGQAAIDALPRPDTAIDWRVSPANAATLDGYRLRFAAAADASPEARAWSARAARGLATALSEGRTLWREVEDDAPPAMPAAAAPRVRLRGPVYVLTDWGCGSACLDAVDLWRALGAVQIGQETSADTLYMDLRRDPLPSGTGDALVPMKVYRGRARGSNVPWRPVHAWTGAMTDTSALERWVATLPR